MRIGVGHPGESIACTAMCCNNFSKADEDWLVPLLSAIAEAAPLLAQDDDAGFMNKVALMLKPPAENPSQNAADAEGTA